MLRESKWLRIWSLRKNKRYPNTIPTIPRRKKKIMMNQFMIPNRMRM